MVAEMQCWHLLAFQDQVEEVGLALDVLMRNWLA